MTAPLPFTPAVTDNQITAWGIPSDTVQTKHGTMSFLRWLKSEEERNAEHGVKTHIERGQGKYAGKVALFRGSKEDLA